MSTKAWVMAVREVCGISQEDLARGVNVQIRTVRRWETPGEAEPPADVQAWLSDALAEHEQAVSELVDEAVKSAKPGQGIELEWYRNQTQRDFAGNPGSPYTFSNAIMRSAGERLGVLGFKVVYRYPDEERA